MLNKVQVISKEAIHPSSPTPKHLRSMPLSLLDQLAPAIYTQLLLFYPAAAGGRADKASLLKASLSKTLTHFYPLAGRIREPPPSADGGGTIHVECNDEGAEFSESRVGADLDSVLREPPMEEFHRLLPNDGREFRRGDPLLAVQLNTFDCGGSVLGVCICHQVADGASMTMLLNGWADVARGGEVVRRLPRFHSASVFPPSGRASDPSHSEFDEIGVVPKRFVITASGVARLRGGEDYYARAQFPTRVEAVSTLVWRCVMRARGKKNQNRVPLALHTVNLRKKMAGKLTDCSFGNLWTDVSVIGEGSIASECERSRQGFLEEKMRGALSRVDEEYARAQAEAQKSGPQNGEEAAEVEAAAAAAEYDTLVISSWCRFPLCETDFGWGGPAWASCVWRDIKNVVVLMDTNYYKGGDDDGGDDGVEVWLWLAKEEMERFEKDPEFRSYVCFD